MLTRALAILALFPLLTATAHAQAMPRYDVGTYCRDLAAFGGGSASVYNGCIEMEQDAYDDLKAGWETIPAGTRAYCDELARFGGGSYSTFSGCVDMEMDAAGSPSTFTY